MVLWPAFLFCSWTTFKSGADLGGGCRGCAPPPQLIQLVFWFIGVEVEQETSAPSPKKNPWSAPVNQIFIFVFHYSKNAFTSIENCLEMGNHKWWINKLLNNVSGEKDSPIMFYNRPLALRGHTTNASFKQSCLESCWWQKLTEHIKIVLHPKFKRKHI